MRKRFLIPLLAAFALPTAVNATNYLECEAIYKVAGRSAQLLINLPSSANELIDKEQKLLDDKQIQKIGLIGNTCEK